jgi:hypothetical protein
VRTLLDARHPSGYHDTKAHAATLPWRKQAAHEYLWRADGPKEVAVVNVGDRIEIESERVGQPPRAGVVTGVKDRLISIRWDDGRDSSFLPKSGSLRVVRRANGGSASSN